MLLGLACNIQYGANPELQRILHKTFVDVMLAESQKEGENLNRLTNRAVYLLCWLRRYTALSVSAVLAEKISAEAVHKLEITGDWMLYLSGGLPE